MAGVQASSTSRPTRSSVIICQYGSEHYAPSSHEHLFNAECCFINSANSRKASLFFGLARIQSVFGHASSHKHMPQESIQLVGTSAEKLHARMSNLEACRKGPGATLNQKHITTTAAH